MGDSKLPAPSLTPSAEEGKGVIDLELDLLVEGLYRRYGYDLRGYSRASLVRRFLTFMEAKGFSNLSLVQARALHDPVFARSLIDAVTVTFTEMFRDPEMYVRLREDVLPTLATYPFLRVWQAGVATGEEVYSLAITLKEAGLLSRSRIYATDINGDALAKARWGISPLSRMREHTARYYAAGGSANFADYYTARYGNAVFDPSLRDNVTFAPHNLVTDDSFNVFHLVFCRNVMIYFGEDLSRRVHDLLYRSLDHGGVLVLGEKENLRHSPWAGRFETIDPTWAIYRKIA